MQKVGTMWDVVSSMMDAGKSAEINERENCARDLIDLGERDATLDARTIAACVAAIRKRSAPDLEQFTRDMAREAK